MEFRPTLHCDWAVISKRARSSGSTFKPSTIWKLRKTIIWPKLNATYIHYKRHRAKLKTEKLLDRIFVPAVAGIERLAPGKSFILAVVKTDAVLAQFPAKKNVLIVDARRKIEQADI